MAGAEQPCTARYHRIRRKLDTLSGGQRRKVALAKVLASDFDVLILDEPTNHLDNAMLSWLEDYMKNYRGTVFMVTHDRYFLDKVSNRILEISHGKCTATIPTIPVFWN